MTISTEHQVGGYQAENTIPASPALELNDLSLSFGGIHALKNISFQVAPESITSIIGPNGAGKTSLFNSISGFYKPNQGTIHCFGHAIDHLPAHKRAAIGLARTFQNISLFRGMSVLDNIKLGRHAHLKTGLLDALIYFGRARREEMALREEIEKQVIDLLEIDHIRNAPIGALPYGLRKRVEMARALAMKPRVLLLDEPVSGMNREETEDMARFILDAKEEWGLTVLMVEHDMGMVMDISDHVIVVNFGEVIANGPPEQVQNNEQVIQAYLGASDMDDLRKRFQQKVA